jgi:hypothetical protein
MNFLSSPNVSLACAIFNGVFAVVSLVGGNLGWAAIGAIFAGFCFNNYLKSR